MQVNRHTFIHILPFDFAIPIVIIPFSWRKDRVLVSRNHRFADASWGFGVSPNQIPGGLVCIHTLFQKPQRSQFIKILIFLYLKQYHIRMWPTTIDLTGHNETL